MDQFRWSQVGNQTTMVITPLERTGDPEMTEPSDRVTPIAGFPESPGAEGAPGFQGLPAYPGDTSAQPPAGYTVPRPRSESPVGT